MGAVLKYCKDCKIVYLAGENKCKKCGTYLALSEHDIDTYTSLDSEKRADAIIKCFGEGFSQWDYKKEVETNSSIGNLLKNISVVLIIVSLIGAILLAESYSFSMGLACFIVSLMFFLSTYGIGEICSLLKSINSKL